MTASKERRGPIPKPRLPDLEFEREDVPSAWFAGDSARTASWNALSVIVCVAERMFVDIGSWLVDHIEDPQIAEQTTLFMQQEAIHSAMHGRMNRVLASRGLPTAEIEAFAQDAVERVRTLAGPSVFMATGLAGEQVIGELAHAILGNPAAMQGLPDKLRRLFFWHWYEEVEHQASLHEGWTAVHGDDANARNLRVLGAAYFLLFIAFTWPASTWALSSRDERNTPSHWRGVFGQMFGRGGLMRGVAGNLIGLANIGHHPADNHDPFPTLDAHRNTAVEQRWEIPPKTVTEHRSSIAAVPTVGPAHWISVAKYAAWLGARTVKFMAAARGAT